MAFHAGVMKKEGSVGMCKTKNFVISKYQTAIRRFLTVEVQV
jgi:hypothetical protein